MPECIQRMLPGIRLRVPATMLLLAALLAGCATPGVRAPETDAAAYREVTDAVVRNDCAGAQRALEAMQAAYPESARLPDAYLESAYTCLRGGDLDATESLISGYLDRFPGHRAEDYAQYLDALTAYARWRRLPPDTPGARIAELAREVFDGFRRLLTAHPQTVYAVDARPVLMDLREGLARVELDVVREDLEARRHDAVIPRARYLLTHYGNTESAPYALAALVKAHRAMGETDQARRLQQQLESDWPDHPALETLKSVQ